jgi:hypothetical protein
MKTLPPPKTPLKPARRENFKFLALLHPTVMPVTLIKELKIATEMFNVN